jgi:hypothetical protein
MTSVTKMLRRTNPSNTRRSIEGNLFDSFFSGAPLDHFGHFRHRRPVEWNSLFNKFDSDDFFQSIDKEMLEEDSDMANAETPQGTTKSWSYSSITRNGQTTSEENKSCTTASGKTWTQKSRTLPDGRSMVSDNRDDAMLTDQQPEYTQTLDDEAIESFERDFQESYFGRSTEERREEEEPQQACTLRDAEKEASSFQEMSPSQQAGRRLNHLADLHEQGLLSDVEFVAAKKAYQSSL